MKILFDTAKLPQKHNSFHLNDYELTPVEG